MTSSTLGSGQDSMWASSWSRFQARVPVASSCVLAPGLSTTRNPMADDHSLKPLRRGTVFSDLLAALGGSGPSLQLDDDDVERPVSHVLGKVCLRRRPGDVSRLHVPLGRLAAWQAESGVLIGDGDDDAGGMGIDHRFLKLSGTGMQHPNLANIELHLL